MEQNIAYIPVFEKNEELPLKSTRELCGMPLVYWVVKAASECKDIDAVYVSTDSDVVRNTVEGFCREATRTGLDVFSKVKVVDFSLVAFAEKQDFQNIVLIQATSPLLNGADLEKGFEIFRNPETDSVLSAVLEARPTWKIDADGFATIKNGVTASNSEAQEQKTNYIENSAFYITSRKALLETKSCTNGKVRIAPMRKESLIALEEPSDWTMVESVLRKDLVVKEPEKKIKMFLTDCDGCLTDGGMYYSEQGDELKKFNTKDGQGLALLKQKGIVTGIVTGESRDLNRRRVEKLGLDEYFPGAKDKLSIVKGLCEKYQITLEEVAYVGDDLGDFELLGQVGMSFAPADAEDVVKDVVKIITRKKGGEGVIREAINLLMAKGYI